MNALLTLPTEIQLEGRGKLWFFKPLFSEGLIGIQADEQTAWTIVSQAWAHELMMALRPPQELPDVQYQIQQLKLEPNLLWQGKFSQPIEQSYWAVDFLFTDWRPYKQGMEAGAYPPLHPKKKALRFERTEWMGIPEIRGSTARWRLLRDFYLFTLGQLPQEEFELKELSGHAY